MPSSRSSAAPTSRSASAPTARALALAGRRTGETGDGAAGDDDPVHARALELGDGVACHTRQLDDGELAGRYVGEQRERTLERALRILRRRGEQEHLGVDRVERGAQLVLVADPDDELVRVVELEEHVLP